MRCTIGINMTFDILGELHALPDLVIARVFDRLTLAFVSPLERSAYPELRDLARRRRWLKVRVGGNDYKSRSWEYPLSAYEFAEMAREGVPPPYYIQRLDYDGWCAALDPLFMTPVWRAYVTAHVKSTAFAFDIGYCREQWEGTAPHLEELRVTSLLLGWGCGGSELAMQLLMNTRYPSTLRRLEISLGDLDDVSLSSLVLPSLVIHLEITSDEGIHLELLPPLPPCLQLLLLWVEDDYDASAFVPNFPKTLQCLSLSTWRRPAIVSVPSIAGMPHLNHNMLVYQPNGSKLSGVTRGPWNHAVEVDLSITADYSGVILPSGSRLLVTPGEGTQANLRQVAHWLPHIRALDLTLPLDLNGVEIPLVETNVRTTHRFLDQVWGIPRVTLLHISQVATSLPLLAFMHCLCRLEIMVEASSETVVIPPPPNLSIMEVRLGKGAALPDLRQFRSVTSFRVSQSSLVVLLDPRCFPPNIHQLQVSSNHYTSRKAMRKMEMEFVPMDLHHLEQLHTVEFSGVARLHLGMMLFPSALHTLRCARNSALVLDSVVFPPALVVLEMVESFVSNPWTAHTPEGTTSPVVYPDSLRVLDLSGNKEITPPPHPFPFPRLLHTLRFGRCAIRDLSPYRFPATLGWLDLHGNKCLLPENYLWPQVARLWIKESAWPLDLLTQDEYDLLRIQIPGVRINV